MSYVAERNVKGQHVCVAVNKEWSGSIIVASAG